MSSHSQYRRGSGDDALFVGCSITRLGDHTAWVKAVSSYMQFLGVIGKLVGA
jgi:ethanolamine transporter EutH